MPELLFRNKATGKVFKIIALDKDKGVVTLQGENGPEFDEPYTKEHFTKLGYVLERGSDDGQG